MNINILGDQKIIFNHLKKCKIKYRDVSFLLRMGGS